MMPYFLEPVWLGSKDCRGPLGWEPDQATAGAAAEVTVAEATSSRLPRDGANVGAAANTIAGACEVWIYQPLWRLSH